MRARSIKPGLFKNEILGTADPLYTIIFEGLWCLADRAGRLEDRPLRIHAEVAPYRHSESTVLALTWLHEHGFIIRYDVGGQNFIQVVNFEEHQQPHIREAQSKIPPVQNQGDVEAPAKAVPSTSQGSAEHSPRSPSSLTPHSLTPESMNTTTPRQRSRRGCRVPDPFDLTTDMREWARTEAPLADLETGTREFVDYWRGIPGARGCKVDWIATWRNRMRELHNRAAANGRNKTPTPRLTRYEQSRQAMLAQAGITQEELDAQA